VAPADDGTAGSSAGAGAPVAVPTRVLADDAPLGTTISTGTGAPEPTRVPADRYTSPLFAALEAERLWPDVWQLACSVDHVAAPGDFFEHRVGPLSILIVRGPDGELRAFQNVCRHRGSALCDGSGAGLTEIRCPFHRWSWDLAGRLREVPSRKGFGVLRNDDHPLFPVAVDTWGPLVFVNASAAEPEPLTEFLEGIPDDVAWCGLDDFRCSYLVSLPVRCNWKTLIDAFSETYHVQGIHREMLPMCDDVNSPQRLWTRHGKLTQPYGLPSPRLRQRPDDAQVWASFIEIMGERIGIPGATPVDELPPVPEVPDGQTLRDVLAGMVVDLGTTNGLDLSGFTVDQLMSMEQYNLFPNITVLVFPDIVSVIRARPGPTVDDAVMDAFALHRRPPGAPHAKPTDIELPTDAELPFGLVLNQDVRNFERAHRGMHQPGFTHLTLSNEECRIANLHRQLERFLDLGIDRADPRT
jgi:choline monooxygenase